MIESVETEATPEKEIKYDDRWFNYREIRKLRRLCERLAKLNKQRHALMSQIEGHFEIGCISLEEITDDDSVFSYDDPLEILQKIIDGMTSWLIEGQIENLKEQQKELGYVPKEKHDTK